MQQAQKSLVLQHEKENIITQTVKNYGARLMSFIKARTASKEDAEDILQDVWLQFSNVTNISEIINAGSWLYKVANNKIIDKHRKHTTAHLEDYIYEDEEGSYSFKEVLLLDNSNNPELKLLQEEIWKQIYAALDELPQKQKKVWIENEFNDKTLQQIADEEGENIKTIISRKQYAVKHLRKQLQLLYNDLTSN